MSQQQQEYAGHDRRRGCCCDGTRQQICQWEQPMPPARSQTSEDIGETDQVGERADDPWSARTALGEPSAKGGDL